MHDSVARRPVPQPGAVLARRSLVGVGGRRRRHRRAGAAVPDVWSARASHLSRGARGRRCGDPRRLARPASACSSTSSSSASVPRAAGERCRQAVDRPRQRARQVAPGARQRAERASDPARRRSRRRAAHRVDAAQRLVQHERQRVQVRGLAGLAAFALLGRHVGERAEHVAGARQHVLAAQLRAAEVGQLGHAAARRVRLSDGAVCVVWDEHVLGLDVAVDHAARVRVRRARCTAPRRSARTCSSLERVVGDQRARACRRRRARRSGRRRRPTGHASYSATIAGCASRALASASRVARSPSSPGASAIRLTATSRCSCSSCALHTTPKPPAPRRSRRR